MLQVRMWNACKNGACVSVLVSGVQRVMQSQVSSHCQLDLPCLQGFVGLKNVSLNCYANAMLQCLCAIPEFSQLYLSGAAERSPGKPKRPVTAAMSALVRNMWKSSRHVNPYR